MASAGIHKLIYNYLIYLTNKKEKERKEKNEFYYFSGQHVHKATTLIVVYVRNVIYHVKHVQDHVEINV